jgi:hypothetical protein
MEVDSVLPADPAAASDTVTSAYRPTAGRTQTTAVLSSVLACGVVVKRGQLRGTRIRGCVGASS